MTLTISVSDLRKGNYEKLFVNGQTSTTFQNAPKQKLSKEQLEGIAKFLFTVLEETN